MAGFKKQAWVTAVLEDQDVPKALVLAKSLRRALTSRSTAVIVSPKISVQFRDLLIDEFDSIHLLEMDRNLCGLKEKDFTKLFALTLQLFDKGVFLSSNMLVMKNCDHVFETFNALTFMEDMDTSVFAFRPSMDTFRKLMEGMLALNGNKGSLEKYLQVWQRNQRREIHHLDKCYNSVLSLSEGKGILGNEKDISIVNFAEDPLVHLPKLSEEKLQPTGILNTMVVKYWNEIYYQDVKPLVDGILNGTPNGINMIHHSNRRQYDREPIAIVGMSCRYPNSNNLDEFFEIIINGMDAIKTPPDFRWTKEQCTRNPAEYRKTQAGFLKTPVDEFDAKFFGISPKEAVYLDPQHRLLHELVWEGLEDAGIDILKLRGSNTGVFIGSWTNDFKDILIDAGNKEFYRVYMGNSIGAAAARISFLLGLTGPSVATESGCSSAMVAVHMACRSLLLGETKMALACGVNLLLHPFDQDEMPMVISPDGHCKTFDAKADGFARAEGCGVLVLKRLSDAIKDKDDIRGLIRGSGMSQEGISRSMGTPTVHCEALAMEKALEDANVNPEDVSYVEAHGTGTVVGDPMEISAITRAYHSPSRKEPLIIGSVKTNVGHTESCSGITGIMKVVLALQHETIPSHRNFESLNPAIDLNAIPAMIPLEAVSWPRSSKKPRLAGVSSFGITGTDAHVIIEEAPEISNENNLCFQETDRPMHMLKVSAKTDEALEELFQLYKEHLQKLDDHQFPDFLYTANSGRANFNQRAVLLAKNKDEAVELLAQRKVMRGEVNDEDIGKICFLFTGQGSQYLGMAKDLFETSPVFRMHFEFCEKFLKTTYNLNIREALWPDQSNGKQSTNLDISRTIYSQTSIFCVEYGLLKLWESWGIKPDFVLGHSLGEFAAAVCAGILTLEDALKLVAERSLLIDDLPHGKMLVIKADKVSVDGMMRKFAGDNKNRFLDYAAINSNQQTVVAGDSDTVQEFSQFCTEKNVKTLMLEATHAFHSKHMDPMLDKYYNVAATVKNKVTDEKTPQYISGLYGTVVDKKNVDADYWIQHTREKVEFINASKAAVELGCKIFIEVGPQPVLLALTMMNNDGFQMTCVPSLKRKESEWKVILESLGKLYLKGIEIDWQGYDQFYPRRKVRIPHYPFQRKKHWPDMMATTERSIHPLIGSVFPNASSTKIFQNGINLRNVEFVKDHAIGNNAIFPGAGYLEMCLAAGHATVEGIVDSWKKPSRAMKVEGLMIEAPLRVEESKTSQVQIVVDFKGEMEKTDWNNISIKIFHRLESEMESVKWLPHASATFSPLPTAQETHIDLDIAEILNSKDKEHDGALIKEVYEKLNSLGLKFGPLFQSLEKVWKLGEDGRCLLAEVKVPTGDPNLLQYTIHPVILDAMVQAIMLQRHSDKAKLKLHVPISIGKFIWLSGLELNDQCFIYTFDQKADKSTTYAVLLNQDGKMLGLMSQVEFIDTTVKAVESVLDQQTISMPDLWEESWRTRLGPAQYRLPEDILKDTDIFPNDESICYSAPVEEMEDTYEKLGKYVYYWILNALFECGWNPKVSANFTLQSLADDLGIVNSYHLLLNYFMEILEAGGVLRHSNSSTDSWEIMKVPLSHEDVKINLKSPLYTDTLAKLFGPTRLMARVGENLSAVLTGKQSSLNVLFSESHKPTVTDFYNDYGAYFNLLPMIEAFLRFRAKRWNERMNSYGGGSGNKYVCRILEVGAGTGCFTEKVVTALTEEGVEFEFVYTDISPAFFSGAQKRFEKFVKSMTFKKLNIEEDPTLQGFAPEYFDLVIASDVIHATKDVVVTLKNIRKIMRPGGMLEIMEQVEKNRIISFIFGIMDGFWRFQDDIRNKHCILTNKMWQTALEISGFQKTVIHPAFNGRHGYIHSWAPTDQFSEEIDSTNLSQEIVPVKPTWLIFTLPQSRLGEYLRKKMESKGRKVVEVLSQDDANSSKENAVRVQEHNKDDFKVLFDTILEADKNCRIEGVVYLWGLNKKKQEQAMILQPFLYLVQEIFQSLKQKLAPRMYVITEGIVPLGDNDLSHFYPSTLWGFLKAMRNEHIDMNCRCIGIRNESAMTDNELKEIFYELWAEDKEWNVAYLDNFRCVPRFHSLKPNMQDLNLPGGTDRFYLILPETNSISDLQFGPSEHCTLEAEEVEIQVKVSALNFRDIFSVMKPTEEFKNMNTIGFDFSGVVKRVGNSVTKWKAGDCVFGVNLRGGSLPSYLKMNQDQVRRVPDRMTHCEAATLPAVFCTSYFCLIDQAKIKPSDTVLIHAASGGVGLSAIQIVKHVGAKIIATAGSKRKQNYLRSLGIQHIFHSRNTNYADEILKVTNGRGVDVVLNSLTSEGFKEATLRACAKGARFIEMSKLSIWKPEEVHRIRPDVEYTIVDVSKADPSESKRLTDQMEEYLNKEIVNPIPYTRFDATNIREALRYLQSAKHIGKVVCVMPELTMERGEVKVTTPLFNERSTYLITGGLGGIGFEVAKWMVDKGAKNILLAGRSPPTVIMQENIAKINAAKGSNLISVQLDIGNYQQCKELLEKTIVDLNLPALRGVMHAAGTLSDGLIVNQTDWTKFSSTFNAKVDGTLNLHNLTKHYNLEHFVIFSSVAALFGSPGQANHTAGNNFEDTFAQYRHSMGLPATSVNWGQWGQVGVATEIDLPGMKALSTLQGLTGLEYCLKSQRVQTAVVNIESFVICAKLFPQIAVYLDEKIWKSPGASGSTLVIRSDEFWQEYDSATSLEEKVFVLKDRVKACLRFILKLDDDDEVEDNTNFQEMGVDSLMFVEIKNALQNLLGDRITVTASALRDCNNVQLLSDQLVKLIEGEDADSSTKPTVEQVIDLIREDVFLPEEISAEGRQAYCKVSNIQNVLLTGVTGTLGPYILYELCKRPGIKKIYCLLRPVTTRNSDMTIKKRLFQHLEKLNILSEIDTDKLYCIEGNVSKERLGIQDESTWNSLVEGVDAVFHCAIRADHIQYYRKRTTEDDHDVRTVNIKGLKNVLEFVCHTKIKYIFHASSLLSVSTTDEEGRLSETWPELDDYDKLTTFAYPISKFVCEILLKKAADRGIPCKVFRLPIIGGHSETGRNIAIQHNHLLLRCFYILKSGMMPSNPFPLALIPVDTCASTSVKIFFDERTPPSDVYNVTHDQPDMDQEFTVVAEELGYHVDIVEFEEFVKKMESEPDDSAYSMFKQIYNKNEDDLMATYTAAKAARIWIEGTCEHFWISKKVTELLPEYYPGLQSTIQCLRRDLQFARKEGFFAKYGLENKTK